jgi:hypothetical protein
MQFQLPNLSAENTRKLLPDNLIFLGYRGSIAHDMYIPKHDPNSIDDKDLMGIFVAPLEHYLGFGRDDLKERFIGEWDVVSYEIRKFIGLLLKCNPNVLSLLWLPDRHVLFEHPLGRLLRDNRAIFVSKAAYQSFIGYGVSQLKRMTHFDREAQNELESLERVLTAHDVDLKNPKPTQKERDILIKAGPFKDRRLTEVVTKYQALCRKYYAGGYMGARRKELVKKFGFDAKSAAHLIRLLRMGVEFLGTGELKVARPDAKELLSIKRGEWTIDQVKTEAERLFVAAEQAYKVSRLPDAPNAKEAEILCMQIIRGFHKT